MRCASSLVCPRCNKFSGFNFTNRKQTTMMCMTCGFKIHARTFHEDLARMAARQEEQKTKALKKAAREKRLDDMTPEQKAKWLSRKEKRILRRQKKIASIKEMTQDQLAIHKAELKTRRLARRMRKEEKLKDNPVHEPTFKDVELDGWKKGLEEYEPPRTEEAKAPGKIGTDVMSCRECHGTGKTEIQDSKRMLSALVLCQRCGGSGEIIRYKQVREDGRSR